MSALLNIIRGVDPSSNDSIDRGNRQLLRALASTSKPSTPRSKKYPSPVSSEVPLSLHSVRQEVELSFTEYASDDKVEEPPATAEKSLPEALSPTPKTRDEAQLIRQLWDITETEFQVLCVMATRHTEVLKVRDIALQVLAAKALAPSSEQLISRELDNTENFKHKSAELRKTIQSVYTEQDLTKISEAREIEGIYDKLEKNARQRKQASSNETAKFEGFNGNREVGSVMKSSFTETAHEQLTLTSVSKTEAVSRYAHWLAAVMAKEGEPLDARESYNKITASESSGWKHAAFLVFSFIIFPVAVGRALQSYNEYGTAKFWQPETMRHCQQQMALCQQVVTPPAIQA